MVPLTHRIAFRFKSSNNDAVNENISDQRMTTTTAIAEAIFNIPMFIDWFDRGRYVYSSFLFLCNQ